MRALLLLFFLRPVLAELRALNIYGVETDLRDCVCRWVYPCGYYMDNAKAIGFNSFRIPFSAEYVNAGDFTILDGIVAKATELRTPLILDYHRTFQSHQGDFGETNLQAFQEVWLKVLQRYKDKPIVEYIDLYNEFQQPNTDTSTRFWSDTMTQAITHLEQQLPNRYKWVVGGTDWGGSVHGIKVTTSFDDRVFYTIHKYSFSNGGKDYEHDWEFSINNLPPEKIIVGEFGWIHTDPNQVAWAQKFLKWLKEKKIKNTAYWTLANSYDTGNLYLNDCVTFQWETLKILQDFWDYPPRRLNASEINVIFKKKLRGNKNDNEPLDSARQESSGSEGYFLFGSP